MDILLTHSYFLRLDPKQWETMEPYPPLATLYAGSMLREEGFEVTLFDPMFVSGPAEIKEVLESTDARYLVIYDDHFNWLTKMCLTNMRHAAWEMAKLAQSKGMKVICCSSDATDHPQLYLENGVDAVVLGEGELTLKELIQTWEEGKETEEIPGIAFLHHETLMKSSKRPVVRDLDQLPNPAWDLLDIREYRGRWVKAHGYFSLNMATTRGCPYKCNWCAKPIWGQRYNSRTPDKVVEELTKYVQEFQVDHVWFCDDIFGLKPGWVKDFALRIGEVGISLKYKIQSRADLLVQPDTVKYLAESGCDVVWIGAESGSQAILDAMDKGITVDQIRISRNLLKDAGVRCAFFLQFGYLGETIEDIRLTQEMVEELMPDEIGVSVSYPLPGTKFYGKVKDQLEGKKSNWEHSDDLDLMFENTYPPEFYKVLQRFIHKRLQKKRSVAAVKGFFRGEGWSMSSGRQMVLWPYYAVSSKGFERKMYKHL